MQNTINICESAVSPTHQIISDARCIRVQRSRYRKSRAYNCLDFKIPFLSWIFLRLRFPIRYSKFALLLMQQNAIC